MLPAETIRQRLRNFLGERHYRKFIRAIPSAFETDQLSAWQAQVWEKFVSANPDCSLEFPQIVEALHACPEFGNPFPLVKYVDKVFKWLIGEPLSIEDIEKPMSSNSPNPHLEEVRGVKWFEMKKRLQPGDLIYEFRSSQQSFANLYGQGGIAVVRNGKVVDVLVTYWN